MGNSFSQRNAKKTRKINLPVDHDLKIQSHKPDEAKGRKADKPLHPWTQEDTKKVNILRIDDADISQKKVEVLTGKIIEHLDQHTQLPGCLVSIITAYLDVRYDYFYSKFFEDQHFTSLVEKYYRSSFEIRTEFNESIFEILKYILLDVHHTNCSGKVAFFDGIDAIWNSVKSSTKEEQRFHELLETFLMGDV